MLWYHNASLSIIVPLETSQRQDPYVLCSRKLQNSVKKAGVPIRSCDAGCPGPRSVRWLVRFSRVGQSFTLTVPQCLSAIIQQR